MKEEQSIQQLVRPVIRDLTPYSSARDEFSQRSAGMVFLDANENPFESDVNRYPDPHQSALKGVIAKLRGVSEDNLLLGNGSDEVLDLLFRVFCEPYQDSVISLPPTYGMYRVLSGINAVRIIEVPLTVDFQPDTAEILRRSGKHSKILFLCSPNNPSGNELGRERVLELLKGFPGLVVIDEAYIDFSQGEGYVSLLEQFPRLVITQTLSKAYGMAGIRLGICIADKKVISFLKRVKPPYNVNVLSQERALNALADPGKISSEVKALKKERKRLADALLGITFVKKVFPSEANFILVRVDKAGVRYQQLIERGIVVRNRSGQQHCENTLRFTVGTTAENDFLISVLKALETTQIT